MTPWMQTNSGLAIDLLEPDFSNLWVRDLARALAHVNRFVGHAGAYSVAQHSVLVSYGCKSSDAYWGLFHDAHEAFTGDWLTPVKHALVTLGAGDALNQLESRVVSALQKRFQFSGEMPASVRKADLEALVTERRDLLGDYQARPWGVDAQPWPIEIKPWSPDLAAHLFVERFHQLSDGVEA